MSALLHTIGRLSATLMPERPLQLDIQRIEGRVTSVKRWSDTHVYGSGGGGMVQPNATSYVSPVHINSQCIQRAEIWLETPHGEQHCVGIKGQEFPVQTGQALRVLRDPSGPGPGGRMLSAVNLATGHATVLMGDDEMTAWARSHRLLRLPKAYHVALLLCAVWGFFSNFLQQPTDMLSLVQQGSTLGNRVGSAIVAYLGAALAGGLTFGAWFVLGRLAQVKRQLLGRLGSAD